jgi:DNA-binding NtrC family response regulator
MRARVSSAAGCYQHLRELRDFVRIIADSSSPVLITGESGAGKELVAILIHESGRRRHQPLVAVNCAAFAEAPAEADLPDRFALAKGGTIFLDDVDMLPPVLQTITLRLLQEHTADVRVVTGTSRDLRKLVAAGSFLEDLHHRINMVPIQMPPLSRSPAAPVDLDGTSLDGHLAAYETQLITTALNTARGNKSRAALLLRVKRSTLGDRMKKLGLMEMQAAV